MNDVSQRVAIIGAGPAGLMAAQVLTQNGVGVDIFDAMPSMGRKFLMAGKSGLNITHAEDTQDFLSRYGENTRLQDMVANFGAQDIIAWMQELGIEPHTGPTGRVFPSMMKSSPLLRAWLVRLQEKGAQLHARHQWQGWNNAGELVFKTPTGVVNLKPAASVFALGGGSWKRLGSDGAWLDKFMEQGVSSAPFAPSNNGFIVDWSDRIRDEFAGHPIKSVQVSVGQQATRGEFVITRKGVESGAIYTVSASLREQLNAYGTATLLLDLLPDISEGVLGEKLQKPRGKLSLSNYLRKVTGLKGVKMALVYEGADKAALNDNDYLVRRLKALPLKVTSAAPLDEAISTIGGVQWSALDDGLMVKEKPGVFCAGEMIDWDAPTGGYLITACMATGRAAGLGVANWLKATSQIEA
ncbi:TIGR03862 family flavoprotein [Hirschia litorea]|uniref:TIGR03862 family flavoprotein n=1 Tax=Hirschia litorea TaxID=1199156 RepID=A0ABW2IKZ7_9PROT